MRVRVVIESDRGLDGDGGRRTYTGVWVEIPDGDRVRGCCVLVEGATVIDAQVEG